MLRHKAANGTGTSEPNPGRPELANRLRPSQITWTGNVWTGTVRTAWTARTAGTWTARTGIARTAAAIRVDLTETTCNDSHALKMEGSAGKHHEGGIEPLHVSIPRELKSRPSTSPTHPGRVLTATNLFRSTTDSGGKPLESRLWGGAAQSDPGAIRNSSWVPVRRQPSGIQGLLWPSWGFQEAWPGQCCRGNIREKGKSNPHGEHKASKKTQPPQAKAIDHEPRPANTATAAAEPTYTIGPSEPGPSQHEP